MSESNGGDISSGFGQSQVQGPVSDEKAEQMLNGSGDQPEAQSDAHTQDAAEGGEHDGPPREHAEAPAEGEDAAS